MRKKIKLSFLVASTIIFLLLGIYLFFFTKFFTVKSVEVEGNLTCIDRENLLGSMEIVGSNFFLIQNLAIEEKLKDRFTCIKSVKVFKKFPNRIFLEVKNRQSQAKFFILKNQESTPSAVEDFSLVDEEGVLFSGSDDVGLKIYSEHKDKDIKKILLILNKTKFFGIEIMEASIIEDTLLIYSVPKIIFALEKDIDMQIASLQLILSKAKIDEETIEFIDLRFDKPVVRFAPKKK